MTGSGPTPPDEWVEVRALAETATPGPWYRDYGDVVIAASDPRDTDADEPRSARVVQRAAHRSLRDPQAIADAAFIAAARTAVPALLAEVDRLRAEREQAARDALTEAASQIRANAALPAPGGDAHSRWARCAGKLDAADIVDDLRDGGER